MLRYTFQLYNCTTCQYSDILSILDVGRAAYFNTMWTSQGLRINAESSDVYAIIGTRRIDLPINSHVVIPWDSIEDIIHVYQACNSMDVNFVNIEVKKAANEREWADFIKRIEPYMCDTARIDLYALGLRDKELDVVTRLFDEDNLIGLLDDVERELCTIASFINNKNNQSRSLDDYQQRFEQLRYEACLKILCGNVVDQKVLLRASGIVYSCGIIQPAPHRQD